MSERFRPARPDELSDIARLVGHSFIGRTQEQLEEALSAAGVELLWIGEEQGRPTSACHLLRLAQWIAGVRIPIMGLAMVTVSPTHRRRRVAGRLCASGLRQARERGDLATALYPFRVGFYADLGYGLAGTAHQYLVPPEVLPDAPERQRVRLVEFDADHEAIRSLYDRWARGETGQLDRGGFEWGRVWRGAERAGVIYRGDGGDAEGYAIVRYRSDLPREERFLDVEERAWLTPAAQRALYAWLGSLGDQWRLISYRAHPEERFGERLREPRLPLGSAPDWGLWFPAATLLHGPMFRLLHARAAWEMRPAAAEAKLTLAVEPIDEQIPENRGPWRLRIADGAIHVEEGAGAVDATLRLPISSLSRLYIAATSASALVDSGAVEIDRPELLPRLDAALRLKPPWTFDRF